MPFSYIVIQFNIKTFGKNYDLIIKLFNTIVYNSHYFYYYVIYANFILKEVLIQFLIIVLRTFQYSQKIKKLQANLHLLEDHEEEEQINQHIIFVDSEKEGWWKPSLRMERPDGIIYTKLVKSGLVRKLSKLQRGLPLLIAIVNNRVVIPMFCGLSNLLRAFLIYNCM